jgi:hypothetical protein
MMSGTAPALGVLVGILLELFGGFVLVAMLPIVSIGGNGELTQHFGAMILCFVVGAVPLIVGLKMSGTSKAKAVLAILIATLVGAVGVLALVHALRFIGLRPDEWSFWTGDSVFWAVYISFAIFIGYHSLAVIRRLPSFNK